MVSTVKERPFAACFRIDRSSIFEVCFLWIFFTVCSYLLTSYHKRMLTWSWNIFVTGGFEWISPFFAFTESCCGHFVSEKEGLLRLEAKQTTILHDSFTSQTHVNRCSSECYLASCTIFQGKHHVRKTCPKYPCISEDLSKKSFKAAL